jgi:LacI family transcriptional regulator
MNWNSGYNIGRIFLQDYKENVSGVFASNDWMALGFIQCLRENNIKIPDEVSIIGCDDINISKDITPSLTTFKWDMKFLLEELFSYLYKNNFSSKKKSMRTLLPAKLIIRDSLKILDK